MIKIILVGIIIGLIYSNNFRLTITNWLNNIYDSFIESVEKKQENYKKHRNKSYEFIKKIQTIDLSIYFCSLLNGQNNN